MDDFFLHAPTREKLIVALNAFMNMMVVLGLICQKVKTCPPAQVQKYCGCVYDTRVVPHLLIPDAKVARVRACLAFLKAGTSKRWLSRLTLAVVVGIYSPWCRQPLNGWATLTSDEYTTCSTPVMKTFPWAPPSTTCV